MKKSVCIFLCLCMLTGLLSGCRADVSQAYIPTGDALVMEDEEAQVEVVTDEAQELSLVYYPEQSMNPIHCTDYTNRVLFPLIYQGLFAVNENYEAVPILCESYTVTPDGRSYVFTINSHATFSDGTPVTAQDVNLSLHTAWNSTYYRGRMSNIKAIYVADVSTLVIDLRQPANNLPLLLDIPIVKETEVDIDCPLGSGPYILGGIEGSRYLSRRSNWWCQSSDLLITAQRIPLKAVSDSIQVRDYFEFDNVGIVCTDPGSDRYVEYRCDYELWDCETGLFLYLGFNMEDGVFQDEEMREAVIKGIDRAYLADQYYLGFATPAQLPASPRSPYYNEALAQNYAYDQAEFLNIMATKNAQGKTIRLLVNSDDSRRTSVAQEIGRMLNASGMIVTVESVSTYYFKERLKEGKYDLYLGQTKLSPNMDLTPFFSDTGTLNYGGMANLNEYTLCLQALANEGNYYTLHKEVMDQALICPLLFRNYAVYAARGLLTQLQPARDNLFFYTIQ